MDGHLIAGHSLDFVAAWWGYSARLPMASGSPVRRPALAPRAPDVRPSAQARLLRLNVADVRDMCDPLFNIRVLAVPQGEPPPRSPVVLRVDLVASGHQRENSRERTLNRKRGNAVRRAHKAGLALSEEWGSSARQTSFHLISAALTRHEAPLIPEALFETLVDEFNVRMLMVRNSVTGEPLGSLLWLRDGRHACVPWAGWYIRPDNPASLFLSTILERTLLEGVDIVDFGWSPTGGGSYRFRRSFGAVPILVVWRSDKPTDPLSSLRTGAKAVARVAECRDWTSGAPDSAGTWQITERPSHDGRHAGCRHQAGQDLRWADYRLREQWAQGFRLSIQLLFPSGRDAGV